MYRIIFHVRHRAFSEIQLDMFAKDYHSPAWGQLMFPHRGKDKEGHRVCSWVSSHPFQELVSNSALSAHGARGIGWQCLATPSMKLWGESPSRLGADLPVRPLRGYPQSCPSTLGGSLINSSVLQSEFGGLIPRFVVGSSRRGSRHCLHLPQERKFSNTWCNSHVEEFEYGSMREKNKDFFIILK